ncbi:MAG TPA: hypothetical protein DDY14_08630 [Chromatiaceae bacterium]|nr:MAG: hypothetical protein N838_29745 [Thiohalocapsa sp. PB-PSB1]HBG95373.1 hypothetical protein [Chromatiaceae bacterium]HCS91861.1 hypothetical protein [Chromatiaceae bacterium]
MGRFFFKCQEEHLDSEAYAAYLKQALGKTRKHIVLVQDGASYHISTRSKTFFEEHKQRLTVFNLMQRCGCPATVSAVCRYLNRSANIL